ncbi:transcription elongation factor [Russula ochroleuca]|jgi:transcription elongation factor S-II|uniref:Transcription elongation factor n=1 Tax=Russula ochroleuca TaxID=152965 RepID=A0A9P5MS15_9AGAM|nr:transcription elongation factor [Russula ochroleuca]
MSDIAELKRLVKSLQQASSQQEIVDILQVLKKEAKITEAVLRESKAGLAVGKLRSHAAKDVSELAKEIVRAWKTAVDKEKHAAGTHSKGAAKPAAPPPRKASTVSVPPSTAGASNSGARTAKNDGVSTSVTGDKTRDKCIEMLYDALALESGFPSDLILQRARAVEETAYKDCKGTTPTYKSKIRMLFVNLKDKNNPGLRRSVTAGNIPAQTFARMTSQDMASEERKAADAKIEEDNLFLSLGAADQQAETDAFQCGRCKQRKCRYRQAQTRSADEPMTTFVTCTNCNHRWKFS